jgi:tetratricopeptide (TPR) repeat protein
VAVAASPLVGRETELARLLDALRSAADSRGRTVFVTGEIGTGKQALLDAVQLAAASDPYLGKTFFATGTCEREHAGQNIYEPFANILPTLIAEDWRQRATKAVFEVVQEVAPDWVAIIPIAGPAIAAAWKSGQKFRKAFSESEAKELAQDRAQQFLAALSARLDKTAIVALVVTQAQWIDAASAALLERVARFAEENRVAVFVVSRAIDADHPLKATRDELVLSGLAEEVVLGGLDAVAVDKLARGLCGFGLAPDLVAWLRDYTGGNPMFVKSLLPVLEERGIVVAQRDVLEFSKHASADEGTLELSGKLEGMTLPSNVAVAVGLSIEQLARDDVELLELGAVHGRRFLSSTISRVRAIEELVLLQRLGNVEKRFGVIHPQQPTRRRLYAYEFAHQLLQQQLYVGLSEPLRLEYHLKVAEALVEIFGESPPQGVLIDIAWHFAEGQDPGLAASYYLRAAQVVGAHGAPPQAVRLAWRGLELAREAVDEDPEDRETTRVQAELVYLLVTVSDAGWVTVAPDPEALTELLAEGVRVSRAIGDDELLARLLHAEGGVLKSRRDVKTARKTLSNALELARRAELDGNADAVITQVAIMTDLGSVIDMEDLDEGLAVLHEAQRLYREKLQPAIGDPAPEIDRLGQRLNGFIGVGEFDRGNLGEARRQLDATIEGLTRLERIYELPRFLNYRAQVELASGDFDAAETDLRLALEGASPSGWTAYNRALLGKVFLDSERYDAAAAELRPAWTDVQGYAQPSLTIPVRAYLIEYLLRPGSTDAELAEARALISAEVSQADDGKFAYGVAWGESLGAELALREHDLKTAGARSARAVQIIDDAKSNSLPIVRTEEVLWRHSRVLAATDSPEAQRFRERARSAVESKAGSLPVEVRAMHARTPIARALSVDG